MMQDLGTINRNRKTKNYRSRSQYGTLTGIIIVIAILLFIACAVLFLLWVRKNSARLDAIHQYENGQLAESIMAMDTVLTMWAPFDGELDEDMLLYKGDAYMKQGDFASAKVVYETLENQVKSRLEGLKTEDKQYDEAAKKQEKATLYHQMAMGLSSYAVGNYQDAVEQLLPITGNNAILHLYVGSAYRQLDMVDEMMEQFAYYSEQYGASGYVSAELASYYLNVGEYEKARFEIDAGLSCHDGFEREIQWAEIVYLEKTLQFGEAYEKMEAYRGTYSLTEEEEKEYIFIKTRNGL